MHWKTVSKECRCWAIITSFSGMKEKLRIIFEATTAHICFSARPSSFRLNRPSSPSHHPEDWLLVPFLSDASVTEEPDPNLPSENYSIISYHVYTTPHTHPHNLVIHIRRQHITKAHPESWRLPFEPNNSFSFPNPDAKLFAPKVLTLGPFASSFGTATSRQSSICFMLQTSDLTWIW